ncbi:MAG: hypothetical protein ACK5HY_12000 [Parahaliea sp.]
MDTPAQRGHTIDQGLLFWLVRQPGFPELAREGFPVQFIFCSGLRADPGGGCSKSGNRP